jgi:hypothetical protein
MRPTSVMPKSDDAVWYQLYFQEPGVAEAEYDRNVRTVFRIGRILISGDAPAGTRPFGMVPRRGGLFSRVPSHRRCPRGGPKPMSIITRTNSPAPGFATGSTGTATSTGIGSYSRRCR